ncbi:MAG: hypothetical protein Q8Q35_02415 [Nanoarchaeota archaeon]|nr:hypothetical protein [Nanoarchaeota archaeon]
MIETDKDTLAERLNDPETPRDILNIFEPIVGESKSKKKKYVPGVSYNVDFSDNYFGNVTKLPF